MTAKKALIVVDVQNDFCPGGALAVEHGDDVVPMLNALRDEFPLVVFTQDWHPKGHGSFASQHPGKKPGDSIELAGVPQHLWAEHCVQETHGAQFHRKLDVRSGDPVIRKGTDPSIDSLSGFFDNARLKDTGLHALLQKYGVTDLTIGGLTTDYCVRFTVEDALSLGYRVTVVPKACRAVNLRSGDGEKALREMQKAGAVLR